MGASLTGLLCLSDNFLIFYLAYISLTPCLLNAESIELRTCGVKYSLVADVWTSLKTWNLASLMMSPELVGNLGFWPLNLSLS